MKIGLGLLSITIALGMSCSDTTGTSSGSSSSAGAGAQGGSGTGGTGGMTSVCADVLCGQPGEVCKDGACVVDCLRAGAQPCATGTVCNASGPQTGRCVDSGGACVTTSEPEVCGTKVCAAGSACDGNGHCYPRVPCADVNCDAHGCWGIACACVRDKPCLPAPLGTPGDVGTLHDNAFRAGIVDLEFAPDCSAWGATLISGPDYLRSIAPDGTVTSHPSITNLNMGEVSILQQVVIPKIALDAPNPKAKPTGSSAIDLEVAATYICCASCGCQLDSVPQGAIRFDPVTNTLPLVIPSETFTTGIGPFGDTKVDTGPAGLSYGMDRVLYVGNIDTNGDYYRVNLATQQKDLVTTFAARVYASTPFDAVTMLVALEDGELRLLRILDGTSTVWAMSDQPVTGLVRDFFDGQVYIARRDGSILRYSSDGISEPFQTVTHPARISIAPDGFLYALQIPPPYHDHVPTVVRFPLPDTR